MHNEELKQRSILLEKIIEKITEELPTFPQGNLRIQKRRNTPQYFLVTDRDDNHGTYIRDDNKELVKQLAQRTYYEKLLREAKREKKAITDYLKGMEGKKPEDVYSTMNDYRKKLVTPLLISDADYAKCWESMPYEKNPYRPEERIHPTERGDLVRSKTEARIADMYYALGIPYRYEAPLRLKNGKVKYPDFTLLNLSNRTEYFHEHLGIMEEENYRRSNVIKLQEYSESGIFTGINLILTFETDYGTLNLQNLRKNIKKIFL